MVDVNTQNKTISVNVSSSGVSSNVNASGDTSHYYSEKAREWAISNRIVDGVDYSSKYYANKSNQSALNAQSFAQSAQDSYNNVENSAVKALEDIETDKNNAISDITTAKNSAVNTVNTTASSLANKDLNNLSTTGQDKFDAKVNKAGDTMTGNLTIDNTDQAIFTIDSDLAGLGSSPSGGANTGSIYFKQKGVLTAIIQNVALENGGNRLQLITRNPDNSAWGAGVNLITSATGAKQFDFPKCTTKATTTSTASGTSVAVIVQNYKNGYSWYRVWSDGWIEQGGYVTDVNATEQTIAFLKAFTTTNYYINCNQPLEATYSFQTFGITSRTTTNFKVQQRNYNMDSGACNGLWYACGY